MKIDPDAPAYPCPAAVQVSTHPEDGDSIHRFPASPGMTIRAAFAQQIFLVILADPDYDRHDMSYKSKIAVEGADALIAELNKTK